jgi:ribosomal-protein-alanine N-acetyltransferase
MDIFVMAASDLEQVHQIEQACCLNLWSVLDYQQELDRKDGLTFVVKNQKQVIGFIVARLISNYNNNYQTILIKKDSSKNPEDKNEIEIYKIAVNPNFQARGFGQKLINQLIDQTKNLQSRSIWLEVRESNTKAINFYIKNRFAQISKRKNYYSEPDEDAIIMKRIIEDI